MNKTRLEFLSDGVFAIVLTLLVFQSVFNVLQVHLNITEKFLGLKIE